MQSLVFFTEIKAMRAAVCLLLAGLASAIPADPRPIHLQTSGSAYAFNTTGHQEIASADAPGLLGWTMYKQCDSAVSKLSGICLIWQLLHLHARNR